MAQPPKKRANEPEPRPIIVKKIIAEAHGGHHGGAWKVAYADFVTAMMAFFLLMWLLGATTEKQRKGLADYFTPTLVQMKMDSAGSNGLFGGDSLTSKGNHPTTGGEGNLAITIPRDATGVKDVGGENMKNSDRQKFEQLKRVIEKKILEEKALRRLKKHIKFTETREGLRIDLIDEADFAMFAMGTDRLLPEAHELLAKVAQVIAGVSNDVIVTGHTDGLPYSAGRNMNNWMLSSSRAEATRAVLAQNGIGNQRFLRIEGVADREPFVAADPYDPRNRRMSVVLAWSKGLDRQLARGAAGAGAGDPKGDEAQVELDERRRGMMRDERIALNEQALRKIDLGKTALPTGATIINQSQVKSGKAAPGKSEPTPKKAEGGHH
ncbi:flagellar motor protein MotB [Sphingobium nicotianae]|uniref:OmpA family protein n=1 Tax=Sphingobium nicotianae TaxID=2782607 RepID=A0A9X1DBM2_9SPHN|nr:flagellar motor protein MotB [Sphingobium nicotianae]MBT2187082.1 OmpA family protein [Sphingobium nicotianae]